MFTIGNEGKKGLPTLQKGDIITCHFCGEQHEVQLGTFQETSEETDAVMFVSCSEFEKLFLVGIDGKDIRYTLGPPREKSEPMSQTEYVKEYGRRCPFCREVEPVETAGPIEIDDGIAMQTIRCVDCKKKWTDIYTLTSYEI